jgi:ATP-dependent helicase HrpB
MEALPIDPFLPQIVSALSAGPSLVLEAPPGVGKTTRVPPALLDGGAAGGGEVVVLEPRRLAARLAARRVAEERGEKLGETVGYQIRFEEVAGPRTRIRFVTEGVLIRRLLSNPTLAGVGAVILDEFHERHLHGDLALALLRGLQRAARPDLKLMVMSATLDTGPIAAYLGGCPQLAIEGKRFEVEVEYQQRLAQRPLAGQVAAAVRRLVTEGVKGDILVFLPGAAEIRRAQATCRAVAAEANLELVMLHGDLPAAEQDRALARSGRRKLILSTNVAETSITIEGVVAVIDSGLARQVEHAPWSGLPTSKIARISRSSAAQRAGRAGRVCPGICLRLYTKQEHDTQPEFETPEIRRIDLTESVLFLHGLGVTDLGAFEWFEAPSNGAVKAAEELLRLLGAMDSRGEITDVGRAMLRFPAHPRLARVLVEAEQRGVAEQAALLAAILSERDILIPRRFAEAANEAAPAPTGSASGSDLLASAHLFGQAVAMKSRPDQLRALQVDPAALHAIERTRRHLARHCRQQRGSAEDPETALLLCLLAGYPDRVARRRHGLELALANGAAALLSENSEAREAQLLIALDAEERRGQRERGVLVRSASAIEPEWLLEMFPELIREEVEALWNPSAERVEVVRRLKYLSLVLEESRDPALGAAKAERVLADAAVALGPRAFAPEQELNRWLARLAFVATVYPEAGLELPDSKKLEEVLRSLCAGRRSFDELRGAGLLAAVQAQLPPQQRGLLEEAAPEKVRLPGGRSVKVHYEPGRPPWIESRLQDFFGLASSPTIAQGRAALIMHMLAPSGRQVQVTTDLAGFWERTYPSLRKDLARRYPKHSWPEDGRKATPPARRR